MITTKMAYRQLIRNKRRTMITLLGIVLSVAMITAIAGFAESGMDVYRRNIISVNGNWHLAFLGITEEQASVAAADPRVETLYTEPSEDGGVNAKFRLKRPNSRYEQVLREIGANLNLPDSYEGYDTNRELLIAEGVAAGNTARTIYGFSGTLIAIVMAGSILVIANAFNISANERLRQFGILKSMGATKEQVRTTVVMEGVILAGIAIPVGVAIGYVVEWTALYIANTLLKDVIMSSRFFDGKVYVVFSVPIVMIAVAVSIATIIISAWIPARKSSKISAIDAIRLSGEVRIKPKKVKVSPLVTKLFGFEGVLADKTLKRNSGKYRATVISLITSIVLFIGGFSFSEYMTKTAGMVYQDSGVFAEARVSSKYSPEIMEIASKLGSIGGMDIAMSYGHLEPMEGADNLISSQVMDLLGPDAAEDQTAQEMLNTILIHSVNTERFMELCEEASVKPDESGALLINRMNASFGGMVHDLQLVNFTPGMSMTFGRDGQYSINILGELQSVPSEIRNMGQAVINVIIPDSKLNAYVSDGSDFTVSAVLLSGNAEIFCEEAEAIWNQAGFGLDSSFLADNIDEKGRLNRNISLLLTVFILGFVGLLSLIAVTSVVGTISTGMTLRRQEFATLQSVGMTLSDLRKMLNYESLLYGLKALVWGLPLGVIVSWLFYLSLEVSFVFSYIPPYRSMIICVAAVLLIVYFTMRYSAGRLGKFNIAETIRQENV